MEEGTQEYFWWMSSIQATEEFYLKMSSVGATPDQLRMILPHSTAAAVTMTANIREWKHILELRCSKMAHPAIRQLLIPLLLIFQARMPEIFKDVPYDIDFPTDKFAELKIVKK